MPDTYFSEREQGARPRDTEIIDARVWSGVIATVQAFIDDGGFGADFPSACEDGLGTIGTWATRFGRALEAEHPEISWPLQAEDVPATLVVLDVIEFCHRHAAKAEPQSHHGHFGHYHLRFDREIGQRDFRDLINRILRRNGVSFELNEGGQVVRLGPAVLRETLQQAVFSTGDADLDKMLETARRKFFDPNPTVRREALEKLWDAFERVKTLEPVPDKRAAIAALLAKVSPNEHFRRVLDEESTRLTSVGNTFLIRHSETTQIPLEMDRHADYLFHRLFALISLCLECRGHGP